MDDPFSRASKISFRPDLNCFSTMLMAKLRLMFNMFTKLCFGENLQSEISGKDFALGFTQNRSSIFIHTDSKFKLKVFDDNQNDLSKNI